MGAPRVLVRDAVGGRGVRADRDQRRKRHRRLGRPPPSRRALRRGGDAAHPPQPRHAPRPFARIPRGGRGRHRAGRRSDDLRAALARANASSARRTTTTPARRARAARRGGRGVSPGGGERLLRVALDAGDAVGAYAGVRPLISTGDPKKSVDISRKAELYETSSGLVTITGGKLTTWRGWQRWPWIAWSSAKGATPRAGPTRSLWESRCPPRSAPCARCRRGQPRPPRRALRPRGARGDGARGRRRSSPGASARRCPTSSPSRLCGPQRAGRDPGGRAVRRTRLGLLDGRGLCAEGAEGPALAARAMAGELGWDEERVALELARWREVARAEGLVPGRLRTPRPPAWSPPGAPPLAEPGTAPEEAA